MHDPLLLRAIDEALKDPQNDPVTQLIGQAARVEAGEETGGSQSAKKCRDATRGEGAVTVDSVPAWHIIVRACLALHVAVNVPAPEVKLNTDQTEGLLAAATLAQTYKSTGQKGLATTMFREMPSLDDWVRHPDRANDIRAYAVLLNAYLTFGGTLTEGSAATARRSFSRLRGCPGLPTLYRPDATSSCDLRTTLAVDRALDTLARAR